MGLNIVLISGSLFTRKDANKIIKKFLVTTKVKKHFLMSRNEFIKKYEMACNLGYKTDLPGDISNPVIFNIHLARFGFRTMTGAKIEILKENVYSDFNDSGIFDDVSYSGEMKLENIKTLAGTLWLYNHNTDTINEFLSADDPIFQECMSYHVFTCHD
jgi:hypothetical protein